VAAVSFTKVVVLMSDDWAREGDSNGPMGRVGCLAMEEDE
jgi:hypothetical protein